MINQIVQESPEQIAKKIIDLNKKIADLQGQLRDKEQLLEQFREENE